MTLLTIGLNHQTAPVDIREKFALDTVTTRKLLADLITLNGIKEALVLSTCNRTEIYAAIEPSVDINAISTTQQSCFSLQELKAHGYLHTGDQCVRHAMRVASGLDSMVLGEAEVLGQLKSAFTLAKKCGSVGGQLERLFQDTFQTAKSIRTETEVGRHPVSIASTAVRIARHIFADLSKRNVLIVGVGHMMRLALQHFSNQAMQKIYVANRTLDHAEELCAAVELEIPAEPIALADLPSIIEQCDIIISGTASPLPIIGKGLIERAIKQRRHDPILMVDVALPRDIEPEVSQVEDVYLYTLDNLEAIINESQAARLDAVEAAEQIIADSVRSFMSWKIAQDSMSTLRAYRAKHEEIRDEVCEEAKALLNAGKEPDEVIQWLAHRLTNKLMHQPTVHLRQASYSGNHDLLQLLSDLYSLKQK